VNNITKKTKKILVVCSALAGRKTSKLSNSITFTVSTNMESSQNIMVTAATVY